jgi:hypothetical protein
MLLDTGDSEISLKKKPVRSGDDEKEVIAKNVL